MSLTPLRRNTHNTADLAVIWHRNRLGQQTMVQVLAGKPESKRISEYNYSKDHKCNAFFNRNTYFAYYFL